MNIRKWTELYSNDARLKYGCGSTANQYSSTVKGFLNYFNGYAEPKEIPTDKIKEWLLQAKTHNTRKQRICAIRSFFNLTVRMPKKLDVIPYPKKLLTP